MPLPLCEVSNACPDPHQTPRPQTGTHTGGSPAPRPRPRRRPTRHRPCPRPRTQNPDPQTTTQTQTQAQPQTDGQTDRQPDRHTDRQTHRLGRQTDRQTDRLADLRVVVVKPVPHGRAETIRYMLRGFRHFLLRCRGRSRDRRRRCVVGAATSLEAEALVAMAALSMYLVDLVSAEGQSGRTHE